MFDVSFGEILIIAVVALIVIGPEKLPKVARTLGLLAGRMQRYVARWIPKARIYHPHPDMRFGVTTQGRSPVR